jgi:nucleoside-diphosphate-sugar epimerase
MINWAVTGATGFVGAALMQRLAMQQLGQASGIADNVLGITRNEPAKAVKGVRYVPVGDFSDVTDWLPILSGIDVLVHIAARVHVMADTAVDPLAEFRRMNVDCTLNLARHAYAAGVQRFVFVSSIGVNGDKTREGEPFTEAHTARPHNHYALSKYEAEQGLWLIAAETGLEVSIIRPPLVYGPGAPGNFGALMRAVVRGYPLPLGSVNNQRSLVALDNLVDFIITCATHPEAANQTFLVCDGQDLSTTELVRRMAQAAGVRVRLLPIPVLWLRAAAAMVGKASAVDRLCGNLQVDIAQARSLLGWVPPFTVEECLRQAIRVSK